MICYYKYKIDKTINKIFTIVLLAIGFPLITSATISNIAGKPVGGLTVPTLDTSANSLNISILISNVASFSAALIAAVAVLFVIYAAYLYMTSAGDPGKVADASKYILWGVIASIVALSAYGIIALAKAVFGYGG